MSLKRVLTLRTVVATSAGLTLATSTFVAAVQVAGFLAGNSAWVAILVGGCLCLLAALCFSELNGQLPSAAGIRLYFSCAFNDQLALTVSILYMVVIMGVVGAESFVLASVLSHSLPLFPPLFWIILMFLTVTALNIRGIKIAGTFQDIITYGLISSLVLLSLLAFQRTNWEPASLFVIGGSGGLIQAIAVGIFLFVGFEWVTPLAEEVTDSRLVSRGMLIAVGLLSITYALFTVAMTVSVPKEILANSPVPQVIFAQSVLGKFGLAWVVILSLAASITTFNAGLLSVSRFVYATAREHALPAVFSRISMRYYTPWVAILTVFVVGLGISITVLLTRKYLVLVNMAAAMESIVYVLAGLAVFSLRKKNPAAKRPYAAPGGPLVPLLTAVIFAVLVSAVFVTDFWAGLFIGIALLVCWWYVRTVVPALKQRHQARRQAARRRPVAEKPDPGGL
ncbi:MAG: APC family permease [Bacillota bacterium]